MQLLSHNKKGLLLPDMVFKQQIAWNFIK